MAAFTTNFASVPEAASDDWSLQGALLSKNGKPFVELDRVKRGVYGTHLADGTRTYWLELASGSPRPARIITAWSEAEPAYATDSAFHELVGEIAERLDERNSPVRFNESTGHPPWRARAQLLASALAVVLVVVFLFGLGGLWQLPIGLGLIGGGIWWWQRQRAVDANALSPAQLISRVAPHIITHPTD